MLLVKEALEEHEVTCDIFVAQDGEQALGFLDQLDAGSVRCPSLIIIDLNLPKKSGLEVLKRVRACGRCVHTPVVILSSSASPKDVEETTHLGADRYIQKPSTLDDFMKIGRIFKTLLESPGPRGN